MRKKANEEINLLLYLTGVYKYELASALNVAESTLRNRMRNELSPEAKAQYITLINKLAAQNKGA